jgi:hypothetical protein
LESTNFDSKTPEPSNRINPFALDKSLNIRNC